jgi:hypothetical protein
VLEQEQLAAQAGKAATHPKAEQAVVTHLDEALGQDMLQEPSHELLNRKSAVCRLAALATGVAERDLAIRDTHNPVIAQRNPKDVRRQIA